MFPFSMRADIPDLSAVARSLDSIKGSAGQIAAAISRASTPDHKPIKVVDSWINHTCNDRQITEEYWIFPWDVAGVEKSYVQQGTDTFTVNLLTRGKVTLHGDPEVFLQSLGLA